MAKFTNPDDAYAEALKRIESCRKEKQSRLDLNGLGLTTLPPEIGQLTALTALYLHDNQLTTLPPEIGQLTALLALAISDNPLPAELLKLNTEGLIRYLRELASATEQGGALALKRFDEAKLLLVGPG